MGRKRKPAKLASVKELVAAPVVPVRAGKGVSAYRRPADKGYLVEQKGVIRNVGEPLEWYLHRGKISQEEYDAADRMRRLHYGAFGSDVKAQNLKAVRGGNPADNFKFSASRLDQIRAYNRIAEALGSKQLRVLEAVVIRGVYANEAARLVREPPREGFNVMKAGLSALIAFLSGRSHPLPSAAEHCPTASESNRSDQARNPPAFYEQFPWARPVPVARAP
jgi:hypothetical protein